MNANARWFTIMILSASVGSFATSTLAQTGQSSAGGSNSNGQATQSPNGSAPETSSSKASAKPSETPSQTPSLGDVARKLKAKNQEGQSPSPGKPRAYTNDNFLPSKTGSGPGTRASTSDVTGMKASEHPAYAVPPNVVILKFEAEKSTIQRPGGARIDWLIQNKSDGTAKLTFEFSVTGPCNYKEEHVTGGDLGPGSSLTDTSYAVAFYESQCAGEYTVQLRLTSFGAVVSSASIKVNVT